MWLTEHDICCAFGDSGDGPFWHSWRTCTSGDSRRALLYAITHPKSWRPTTPMHAMPDISPDGLALQNDTLLTPMHVALLMNTASHDFKCMHTTRVHGYDFTPARMHTMDTLHIAACISDHVHACCIARQPPCRTPLAHAHESGDSSGDEHESWFEDCYRDPGTWY